MYQVTKRDGKITDFHLKKIVAAITKAFEAQEKAIHPDIIDMLALKVTADFEPKIQENLIRVEDIQDSVESVLIQSGYGDVAKGYILYRKQREKIRNMKSTVLDYKEIVDNYVNINDWRVKENSTVTYSVGGLILSNSGAITANYWLSEIYDEEIGNAHRNADIHIHDLSMLTGYCAGWSLKQLIQEGLGGVGGKITSAPAKHHRTLRPPRPGRHPDGHAGQGLRRRRRRLHHRPQGDHRHAAPAFAPLPLLQLAAPRRRRCRDRDVQDARREQ